MDEPGTDPMPGPDELDSARAESGPLSASIARRLLDRGQARLQADEALEAFQDFQRVIGHADPNLTAEASLGAGDALFRLDSEAAALQAWESVVRLPESPSTYAAWRRIAGARVRANDLGGARDAYREADRRAPAEDRPEIASRLGWLSKEMGQAGAASRYFARSRGTRGLIGVTQALLAITIVISLLAILTPDTTIADALALVPSAVAHGELWRLFTVTLLHDGFLHLFFNMYALYLIGPIVESTWGGKLMLAFYLLTAAAASTASFVITHGVAVGASGAIFGLIGVLFAGTRAHHPLLDQRARAIAAQLVPIIVLNLIIGFAAGGSIDNAAHIGGLVAGMWLGFVVPPGKVPTLRSAWQNPRGDTAMRSPLLVAAGVVLLVAVTVLGLAYGGVRLG
jgi:membrane associated rhomboid family serine protease